MKWNSSVVSDSLWPHGLQPTRLLHPWESPGKNTAVGYHFLLQGIFPTQGSILCWQVSSWPLAPSGKPKSKKEKILTSESVKGWIRSLLGTRSEAWWGCPDETPGSVQPASLPCMWPWTAKAWDPIPEAAQQTQQKKVHKRKYWHCVQT